MFSEEWNQILDKVLQFQIQNQSQDGSNRITWFRGQNNADYKLVSGLYRTEVNHFLDYGATEKDYYNLFNKMGYTHHNESDWNLLYIMQHHGLRTRLLDWTESFSIALYFASLDWDFNSDCSIWMLKPLELNRKTLGNAFYFDPTSKYEDLISDISDLGFNDNTIAMYPHKNSSRILVQQGMFTLQGKAGIPLEEEHNGSLIKEGYLKKINLGPNLRKDIKNYLNLNGISRYSLFPDLDGLANHINSLGYCSPRSLVESKS